MRMAVIIVAGMIIVAVVIMAVIIVILKCMSMVIVIVVAVIVVAMIVVAGVVIVAMFIVAVVIVAAVIAVAMSMNNSVEVFGFSINSRRSDGSLDGKYTVVGQSPFEDVTKLTINGVVLRLAIEVGFHPSMTLNSDHRGDLEFTFWNLFTTTMSAMGMDPADCSITGQQQGKPSSGIQERKTRKDH